MAYPENDTQYTEEILTDIREDGDGWDLAIGSMHLWTPKANDVIPKTGDTLRTYGEGFGRPVRGIFINDQCLRYMTAQESDDARLVEVEKNNNDKKKEFEQNKDKNDARIAALPVEFRNRFKGFHERKENFRWDQEPYELFVCEQAMLMANSLGSSADIILFYDLSFDEQLKKVPGLDDGHSGNTFEAATKLARCYLDKPELIPKMHGALCPLLGCDTYGCWSSTQSQEDEEPI